LNFVLRPLSLLALLLATPLLLTAPRAQAQAPSSSSSSSPGDQAADQNISTSRPRIAQIETGGSSVTLETSEPLFDLGAALNACDYNADLDQSLPVRAEVRRDMNTALAASEPARTSRDALCKFLLDHKLSDPALNVGQYVSLALYLSPPPELTPNVDETELPPQAEQVINVLPLLRTFAQAIDLHYIWLQHRNEYEAAAARIHDPLAKMILNTNLALHLPVSSYDGRRFLILLEPMLSPALTNARIYGSDYIIVTSPSNVPDPTVPVRLDQIRHIYLHYIVEPMIYSRGSAMERIQPLLRGVADAPIDFIYKSDIVALLTECLIKAVEARMYTIPGPAPEAPKNLRSRADEGPYLAAKAAYDRETDFARNKLVNSDEAQGWVLTGYFYQSLQTMGHNGDGLRDEIAPMIYGMDVEGQTHHARQVVFLKDVHNLDPLRPETRVSAQPEGLDLAELDLIHNKLDDAEDIANKALTAPQGDRAHAQYILARIHLMHGQADEAQAGFEQTLKSSHDPRTIAWSHIYLGRLYDVQTPPARDKAIAEYNLALSTRDSRPDTKTAAEAGLSKPFALPQREQQKQDDTDTDADFDPTGKKEKQAYKPPPLPPQ
jgi:tetratricopeptide (TPR) repeat protein